MEERAARSFTVTAEDTDCRYCLRFKRNGCRERSCPWLKERIQSGYFSYHEAIKTAFGRKSPLWDRLIVISQKYPGSLWNDSRHSERMTSRIHLLPLEHSEPDAATLELWAALYLMTATPELYRRTFYCFEQGTILFQKADMKWITMHDYTIFMAAKDVCRHTNKITEADMQDREVISDEAFRLLVNAHLICRFGTIAFLLRPPIQADRKTNHETYQKEGNIFE